MMDPNFIVVDSRSREVGWTCPLHQMLPLLSLAALARTESSLSTEKSVQMEGKRY